MAVFLKWREINRNTNVVHSYSCCVCTFMFNLKTSLFYLSTPDFPFCFNDIQVHDVRFQTQTTEEKEAWIRALSNGISRARNKVFDEVSISVFSECNMAGGKKFCGFSWRGLQCNLTLNIHETTIEHFLERLKWPVTQMNKSNLRHLFVIDLN